MNNKQKAKIIMKYLDETFTIPGFMEQFIEPPILKALVEIDKIDKIDKKEDI